MHVATGPQVERSENTVDHGLAAEYQAEAKVYAQHILRTKPDAKIGILSRTTTTARTPEGPRRPGRQERHDRQGGLVRGGIRPGFAGSCSCRLRPNGVLQHHHAEVRRAGDPQSYDIG